ncbi:MULTISPECIES: fused DSP-PTPase phosphatase/NAD kinase-like protein [Pseudomonas]|uniref:phosphatase domain-containing putative toxin n=1 Tax=Pseudomonas TaxID=286 RepID=UPI0022649611|nr:MULTISPECIES: dual specificity protein phosphatase family protein [Pseudomonas]MBW8354007.1 dual specificity protein phosphatase family protein [Pseudomonas sp.]
MNKDVSSIKNYVGDFPSKANLIFKDWDDPLDTPDVHRSSQPYYKGKDEIQDINDKVLDALKLKNVKTIVSLNHLPAKQSPEELRKKGIEYLHLKLEDYAAPSVGQLKQGCDLIAATHKKKQGSLVYCGAGFGRTGTMMTAYQIYITPGCTLAQLQKYIDASTAETAAQEKALRDFHKSLYL